jgi:hypothetical protein
MCFQLGRAIAGAVAFGGLGDGMGVKVIGDTTSRPRHVF